MTGMPAYPQGASDGDTYADLTCLEFTENTGDSAITSGRTHAQKHVPIPGILQPPCPDTTISAGSLLNRSN